MKPDNLQKKKYKRILKLKMMRSEAIINKEPERARCILAEIKLIARYQAPHVTCQDNDRG